MTTYLGFDKKIGILDPDGTELNPLNGQPFSDNYKELAKMWSSLPAYAEAKNILESIRDNQLTIVTSSTGSGKSVIIPKLALHYTNYEGRVIMTLPKRVITYSGAIFGADCLDVKLGTEVGYQFKGSPKEMVSDKNKLIYITDGSMIMRFLRDPSLSEYRVVIMDEIHEASVRIELLLSFVRDLIKSGSRPDLRVILMSATVDTKKFINYFSDVSHKLIDIAGQPNYEIKVNFLPEPTKSFMTEGQNLMNDLIMSGVKRDILFFITTSNEALQVCRTVKPRFPTVYCIEVYSDMNKTLEFYAKSKDAFLELGNFDQKVVVATNVAESSLTIDGLKYVIDSGFELFSYFDPDSYGNILEKRLISKAQALQRRGRVGRTEPGICYHLLTKSQFDTLALYPEPSISKEDITMDFLKVIQISGTLAKGTKMMFELIDKPKKTHIAASVKLFNMYNLIDASDRMTSIANEILEFSSLPINQSLFMIYAFQLHCAKEASIIVAMIEVLKGKLINLFFKLDAICNSEPCKGSSAKYIKAIANKQGDHLTLLDVYQQFRAEPNQKEWAKKYGIRLDALNTVTKTYNQYFNKLLNFSRAPPLARIANVSLTKRLVESLKLSHQHLTAKNMQPVITKTKIDSGINKDSITHIIYNKKDLANKKFIYNELTSINGNWDFNVITFI